MCQDFIQQLCIQLRRIFHRRSRLLRRVVAWRTRSAESALCDQWDCFEVMWHSVTIRYAQLRYCKSRHQCFDYFQSAIGSNCWRSTYQMIPFRSTIIMPLIAPCVTESVSIQYSTSSMLKCSDLGSIPSVAKCRVLYMPCHSFSDHISVPRIQHLQRWRCVVPRVWSIE